MNLNGVKPFLRNVLDDLVEKRLWPVAAGLVAALVAVPLLLGSGGSAAKPAPAPAAKTAENPPLASQALVSMTQDDTTAPAKAKDRPGSVRNPFKQLHVPKPVAPATASSAASGGPRPSSGGGASGGTTAPSTTSGTAVAPTKAPATAPVSAPKPTAAPNALDVYRVSISFGPDGQQRKVIDNPPRLLSLPSLQSPMFVFYGVTHTAKGTRVVFLTDPSSNPAGDGTCLPSGTFCEMVVMKVGDIESFTVPAPPSATAVPDAGATTTPATPPAPAGYTVRVRSISKVTAATKASAARAHRRKSLAGAAAIEGARGDSAKRRLAYSFRLGVLLPVKHRKAVRAQVAGGPVLSSLGQAVAALPVAPGPVPAP